MSTHALPPGWTGGDLSFDFVAGRLEAGVPRPELGPDEGHEPLASPIPAAVLVPLVRRPGGLTVMLTRRTDTLPDHAGQISFPGGRIEADDASPEAAALRETEEEVGLARAHVTLLGRLASYDVLTGFRIIPVVGWVEPPFDLRPDPVEVAEVFEVPLGFLLDPANHQKQHFTRGAVTRSYFAMPWQGYHIWGATAGILRNFYRTLAGV